MPSDLYHVLPSSIFCIILISFRCGYRILRKCNCQTSCHRKWHADDAWMAFALVPLVARSVCIEISNVLSAPNASVSDGIAARKLLIPSRIFYALFLWCLKICLVQFYFRFSVAYVLWYRCLKVLMLCIFSTFVAVVLATVLECRPLPILWQPGPADDPPCRKALGNLLTMAISNILTDAALIVLPIPIIWRMTMPLLKKLQLMLLFGVGIFVVGVTIARVPLIIDASVPQQVRSLWASVEIATACAVANVAFYYALIKDTARGHPQTLQLGSANPSSSYVLNNTSRLKSFGSFRKDDSKLTVSNEEALNTRDMDIRNG